MKQVLRLGFPVLGWVLYGAYAAIILSLFALGYSGRLHAQFELSDVTYDCFSWYELRGNLKGTVLLVAITFCSQSLFLFGSGRFEVGKPLRRRRLLFPLAVASFLAAWLIFGGLSALQEFFQLVDIPEAMFWTILGALWPACGIAFYIWLNGGVYLQVLRKLLALLLAGSLLGLMLVIPLHHVASRKPGLFAGLGTEIAINVITAVMFWAFGPATLVFAFGRKTVRALQRRMEVNLPSPSDD